jgi:hypothetical protein
MKIVVVSSSKEMKKYFTSLGRTRKYEISYLQPKDLQGVMKHPGGEQLLYIDVSDFSDADFKKKLTALEKNPRFRFGVIDKNNSIADIAAVFHKGAVDYVNAAVLKEGVRTKRITNVLEFRPFDGKDAAEEEGLCRRENWKIAEKGWDEIQSGKEYTFWLLYIELDMIDEWKTKSGKAHIDDVQKIFHHHIETNLTPLGGRTWMWMNQGGVFLFPFKNPDREPLLTCIKFILNRTIISIEEFGYNSAISYKMALHVGNTVYQDRGRTGHIVSDTVNFLFHLGQLYTKEGHFYITGPAYNNIPEKLQGLFSVLHDFEGESVYSMRLPKE